MIFAEGRLRIFGSIVMAAALFGLGGPAMSASWLEQKLKEVDRSLCQSSQSIKCKGKRQQVKRVKAAKPVEQAAAEPPASGGGRKPRRRPSRA